MPTGYDIDRLKAIKAIADNLKVIAIELGRRRLEIASLTINIEKLGVNLNSVIK